MAEKVVYSKDKDTSFIYGNDGQLISKVPGRLEIPEGVNIGNVLDKFDPMPTLNGIIKLIKGPTDVPGNHIGAGPQQVRTSPVGIPKWQDAVTDVASQAPLMVPGNGIWPAAGRIAGSFGAGTMVDQLLNPDKTLTSSMGDAALNTTLGVLPPWLSEKAGIQILPRTVTSETQRGPTTTARASKGTTTRNTKGIQWQSSTNGTTTPGDTTTTTTGPHAGWLGNLMDALSSIKLTPAMKQNVSPSGYVYPKPVPVQRSPLEKALIGLGFNLGADATVNKEDQ